MSGAQLPTPIPALRKDSHFVTLIKHYSLNLDFLVSKMGVRLASLPSSWDCGEDHRSGQCVSRRGLYTCEG